MTSVPTDARTAASRMTRAALTLLDIPFEPATALNGERFDHVIEALSTQLSDAAGCELGATRAPTFRPATAPPLAAVTTRRAQATLREHVLAGRMPGNDAALDAATTQLGQVSRELRDIEQGGALEHSAALVTPLVNSVERLHSCVSTYAHSHRRLSRYVGTHPHDLPQAADSATRAERALTRCLDRTGDERTLR